jgi:SulP family sulfate permease
VLVVLTAGAVIGVVEVVLAVSFAALVYGGYLAQFLPDGIGLYLVAASLTLAVFAWRGGRRGVVASVQDAAAAVLAVVATDAALDAFGSINRAFLTVVAATVVVTVLTGVTFLLLGSFRLGNLARFIPYPVVGGFLAGTGWLLFRGGLRVAAGIDPELGALDAFFDPFELVRWVPALVFGIVLLVSSRIFKRPMVIPIVIGIGVALFVIGMLVTGSSFEDARLGLWFLGPFDSTRLWQPWTLKAATGADWSAVLGQAGGIATAIFVAILACLFNVGGVELLLQKDLDANEELRDTGWVNVITGLVGGPPSYHALSLTSLADQMAVDGRAAGLVGAVVPLGVVVFGGVAVGMIPRMIVGGVLVFVGLSFLVTWVWDVRRSLPIGEYLIAVAILVTIATWGLFAGFGVGLILAVVLFAVSYGRIEMVHELPFGGTYRSNVDRPAHERSALDQLTGRVMILRLDGFVFFGTASGLLERIRKRVEAGALRFLVVDLQRVTGMDASAVLSFRKAAQLAKARGFELLFAAGLERVEAQLRRGGVVASEGIVLFEPDLDRALELCEEGLLAEAGAMAAAGGATDGLAGLPPHLASYLERRTIEEGDALIRQGDEPDDLFVLASGRLRVELSLADGTKMRVSTVRPGVVVGEIGVYTGEARTADVVAEAPSVVLCLGRASLERLELEEPENAAALHRWLATMLSRRLTDSLRMRSALHD